MVNPSHANWPTSRLDDAIARIVDERGDGNDWRTVVDYGNRFGNDVVIKAAQSAALKLRKSRVDSPR
jgi:hypothetical protein